MTNTFDFYFGISYALFRLNQRIITYTQRTDTHLRSGAKSNSILIELLVTYLAQTATGKMCIKVPKSKGRCKCKPNEND